jgi:serine/threonine-protein kinase
VEVTDFGLLATGQPYLVMERLSGADLADWLEKHGALPPVSALRIAREIALALEAAHAAGIVHNDLKPENVVLLDQSTAEAPRLKVVDFGASSLAGLPDEDKSVFGTPAYMAPERIQLAYADGRADLYALGVMLHEMISGSQPFGGSTSEELLNAHLTTEPPLLTSPFGPLPPAVTRLVHRALRKQPNERHQSAAELLIELDRALDDLGRGEWRRWLP